jgi:hypothetical protein
MTLKKLIDLASDKERFTTLETYISFCKSYLNYIEENLQARIVSKRENHYQFFQYKKEGGFQVTRPINSNLMFDAKSAGFLDTNFISLIRSLRERGVDTRENRILVNRAIYTVQQSIGAALDALPAGKSNKARKINGDLFERLIKLILKKAGVDCESGEFAVPINVEGVAEFKMKFQQDLIVKQGEFVKIIGSVKTSSKDRPGKIFVDKFLFNRLTGKDVPHVAIFLNDVQRKGDSPEKYSINSTFLPGHFKAFTVKLNPLDGVYYCDIRPNMMTEPILKDHIKTFDHFLFSDLWALCSREAIRAEVRPTTEMSEETPAFQESKTEYITNSQQATKVQTQKQLGL